ncbi:hypothetical protein BDV28DRAFT_165011 [Aspergillus coremiiformis]|uniref:Uncharacterized protein n=1 Tax=Aspergillus coremiiformis TaxID=138285 RepID=A0A5N6Z6L4_9EURO|nr:hypothetical protein BDV28DRAFT_165011 [Aspergillus coremiiformis]
MSTWEVTSFSVRSSTASGTSDVLYANGRMQVPVIASIKAIDTKTNNRYQLTDAELQKIQLVDYLNTSIEIKGTWFYSTVENEFAHSLGASAPVQAAPDDSAQSIYFWVSTTKVENKNIGARITQPDKTTVTTHSTSFDSRVTLTGILPVSYTTDNITVRREDTANGKWQTVSKIGWTVTSTQNLNWDQDNYYITMKDHPFLKADIHEYDATGKENGVVQDSRLKNCFGYYIVKRDLRLFFIWNSGPEVTTTAGVFRSQLYGMYESTELRAYTDIKVNQIKNAFCLTRLWFSSQVDLWGKTWSYDTWFVLYDTFGNSGAFYAKQNSYNTIEIKNKN